MDSRDQSNAPPSAHESGTTTMTHFLDHHRDFLGASTPKSPSPVHTGRTRANSPFPVSRILKGRRRPAPLDMDAIHATYGSNTRRRVERWNDNVTQASYGIGHASDGTEIQGNARAPDGVAPAADNTGHASERMVHPFGVYPADDDDTPVPEGVIPATDNTGRASERVHPFGVYPADDDDDDDDDTPAPEDVVPAADNTGRASERVHPFGIYPADEDEDEDANAHQDVGDSEHLDVVADGINNTKPLRRRPDHLNLSDARKYGSVGSGPQQARFPLITPAEVQHRQVNWDGSSSIYSTTISPFSRAPTVSPLVLPKNRINILQGYTNWRDTTSPDVENTGTPIMTPTQAKPVRSKSVNQIDDTLEMLPATTYQPPPVPASTINPREPQQPHQRPGGLTKSATVHALGSAKLEPTSAALTGQFSPLTPWVLGFDQRKATKNLFGDNGWLQDGSAQVEAADTKSKKSQSSSSKTAGFLEGIKKMAKEIVSF